MTAAIAAALAALALSAALHQASLVPGASAAPGARPAGLPRARTSRLRPARWRAGGAVPQYVPAAGSGACAGWLAGGGVCGAMAGAGAAALAVRTRARRSGMRAVRDCERGVAGLARSLADGLRGGASIRAALGLASHDRSIPPALRHLVRAAHAEVSLGSSVSAGIDGLGRRGGPGLRLLCGTVALHMESGGALTSELDRLAAAADRAIRVEDEREAATAGARATVRTVALLPVLAIVAAQVLGEGSFLGAVAGRPLALALLLLGVGLQVTAMVLARTLVGGPR